MKYVIMNSRNMPRAVVSSQKEAELAIRYYNTIDDSNVYSFKQVVERDFPTLETGYCYQIDAEVAIEDNTITDLRFFKSILYPTDAITPLAELSNCKNWERNKKVNEDTRLYLRFSTNVDCLKDFENEKLFKIFAKQIYDITNGEIKLNNMEEE